MHCPTRARRSQSRRRAHDRLLPGSTPSKSNALACSGVGLATIGNGCCGASGSVTWFSVSVPRSASSVWKLCTGSPSGVCLLAALALVLAETCAFSTGDCRSARAPARSSSFYVREVAESRNPDRIREPLFPCRRRRKPPQRPATDASPPSAGRAPGAWPGPRRRRVGPFSSSAFRAVFELGRPVAAIPARPQRKRGYRPASQKDRNAGMSTGP